MGINYSHIPIIVINLLQNRNISVEIKSLWTLNFNQVKVTNFDTYSFIVDQTEGIESEQPPIANTEYNKEECFPNPAIPYLDHHEKIRQFKHRTYLPKCSNNQIIDSKLRKTEICNKSKSEDIETNSRVRNDVSYKNVFRATKKYYLALFKASSKFFKTHTKPERKKIAYSELEEFVQNYFINKDFNQLLNELNKEELVNIVGRIVIPEYMTKQEGTYIFRKEWGILHDCIYRYNANNASKLYDTKYVGRVVSFFLQSDEFSEMVQTDDKLRKQPYKHLKIAQEIMNSFQNFNMKISK